MKRLIDDTLVTERSYYFLLDWNEHNGFVYIEQNFNTRRLCDLELPQYIQLFKHATEVESSFFQN